MDALNSNFEFRFNKYYSKFKFWISNLHIVQEYLFTKHMIWLHFLGMNPHSLEFWWWPKEHSAALLLTMSLWSPCLKKILWFEWNQASNLEPTVFFNIVQVHCTFLLVLLAKKQHWLSANISGYQKMPIAMAISQKITRFEPQAMAVSQSNMAACQWYTLPWA